MAKTLYSIAEESTDSASSNELLIDKVLKLNESKATPLNVTADLIKQRHELKAQIEQHFNDPDDTNNTDPATDPAPEGDPAPQDPTPEDPAEDPAPTSDNEDKGEKKDTPPAEAPKPSTDNKPTDDESELTDASDSKDGLAGLIGSGLGGKKTSTEHRQEPAQCAQLRLSERSLRELFKPLCVAYEGYMGRLRALAMESEATPITEQRVAYIKEPLLESLRNVVEIAGLYSSNNQTFIGKISEAIKQYNERFTTLSSLIEQKKYSFTDKLVSDREILEAVSLPKKSDPRETTRVMAKYVDDMSRAVNAMLHNDFKSLKDAFTTNRFIGEEDSAEIAYSQILPGFHGISASIPYYTNYTDVNAADYTVFKSIVVKTEDVYELDAIGVNEEKELTYLFEQLGKLIVSVGLFIDNMQTTDANMAQMVERTKSVIYDIEQAKYSDMSEVGVDSILQDLIRFKLLSEAYMVSLNVLMDYLVSMNSVVNVCVELDV